MKILQVFNKIGLGGTERMIESLSRGLLRKGHKTCVWAKEKGENIEGVQIIISDNFPEYYEPDIILVHGGYLGAKYYLGEQNIYNTPIIEVVHRNVLVDGVADYYITPSKHTFDLNSNIGNKQIVNNCICFNDIVNVDVKQERFKQNIGNNDIVIFRHARFVQEKGWLRFIWIMDCILKKYNNVVFVICGEGDKKITDFLIKWSKDKKCLLLGWKKDVEKYLAISDIYMETTFDEAFGLGVAEAAAAKLPVIAFDVPGIREIIGTSEYCIPDDNLSLFLKKAEELICSREKRVEEGICNYKNVINKYKEDLMVKLYTQVFTDIKNQFIFRNNYINDNTNIVNLNKLVNQKYLCKKFGVFFCIRVYWLLYEWRVRTHKYNVEQNIGELRKIKTVPNDKGLNEINLAVELIAQYTIGSCCMNKTMVKAVLLLENNFDFIIVYGVFKKGERLEGHTWIEAGDVVLDNKEAYKSCKKVIQRTLAANKDSQP